MAVVESYENRQVGRMREMRGRMAVRTSTDNRYREIWRRAIREVIALLDDKVAQ